MIKYNCDLCSKEFEVRPYKVRDKEAGKVKGIYCSQICMNAKKTQSKLVTTSCAYCNTEFRILPSILRLKKWPCCSEDCAVKFREHDLHRTHYNCDLCGESFVVLPNVLQRKNDGKQHAIYCSSECHAKSKMNGEEIPCVNCGIPIYRTIYRQNKRDNSFCSNVCQTLYMYKTRSDKRTGIEILVADKLASLGITYEEQYVVNDKFITDFYLPEYNIIIEAFGDYWHSNPIRYPDNNLWNETQCHQHKKDKARLAYLTACGYNLFILWETDINTDLTAAMAPILALIHSENS